MTTFHNIRSASSCDLAVQKFRVFFVNRHFHISSLVRCPSLDFQHQSIKYLYTVNMKFYQFILDQFIQVITRTLPKQCFFFSVQQKKF